MEEVVIGGKILKAKVLVLIILTGMAGFGCGARVMIATGVIPK